MFKFQWRKRSRNPMAVKSITSLYLSWILHENEEVFARWMGQQGQTSLPVEDTDMYQSTGWEQTLHSSRELHRKMLGEPPPCLKSFTLVVTAAPETLEISMLLTILPQIQVASSGKQSLTFLNKRGLHHSLATALLISPGWGYVKHPCRVSLLTACLLSSRL